MTQNKKIIACLDVDGGRVVKGKKFDGMKDIADPLELAIKYNNSGIDELVFYDITASTEDRNVFLETIEAIAKVVDIPFTVGGGIRTIADIEQLFAVGVDKVSINSAAIKNPLFIREAADIFGSERIVFAMDVKEMMENTWSVYSRGGKSNTGLDAIDWAKQGEKLGAGEIVVNSIDGDGEKKGYSIRLMQTIADAVNIPIVASGGAGEMKHFQEALTTGNADGALAASVFHYNEINVQALKQYLQEKTTAVGNDK